MTDMIPKNNNVNSEINLQLSDAPHEIATSLRQYGIALLRIPDEEEPLAVAECMFRMAANGMDRIQNEPSVCKFISESSAHAVGYHAAGGMSQRYNEFREGFVWSDGKHFEIQDLPEFSKCSRTLEHHLHSLASSAMRSIAAHLQLDCTHNQQHWFEENLGPTKANSQWHVKRFVAPSAETLWLPTHTDPSLVSVVIHDLPGATVGGSGFQFQYNGTWHSIPVSGHSVAIVLVGSVLQHITGGLFQACRHKVQTVVIQQHQDRRRMAATYFLRPAPESMLCSPPSTLIRNPTSATRIITFDQWLQKTARNYEKSQRKQKR